MIVKGIRDKDINLYKFNIELIETNVIVVENINLIGIKSKSWHERLGHLGTQNMRFMSKWGLVVGILAFELLLENCEPCMCGRQFKECAPKESTWRAHSPLELVHYDICGPLPTTSLKGMN